MNFIIKTILATAIMCLGLVTYSQAQDSTGRYIHRQSSASANYIFAYGYPQITSEDSSKIVDTKHFVITRFEFSEDNVGIPKTDKVMILKPVQNVNELRQIAGSRYIQDFKSSLPNNPSDQDVVDFFNTYRKATDYYFTYLRMETRIAAGHVLKDENVEKGKLYFYSITRVMKNGVEEDWGACLIRAGVENYTLDYLNPIVKNRVMTDSGFYLKWELDVSQDALNSITPPKNEDNEYVKDQIEMMPYMASGLKAKVYHLQNGRFVENTPVMGQLKENSDSLEFRFSKESLPGKMEAVYIRLQDDVGNLGPASDTIYMFNISPTQVPLLNGLQAEEIKDGIRLTWDSVPNEPYISGILLYRYDSRDSLDTLAIIPKTDTFFIDYDLELGQLYRYKGKLLYGLGVEFEQDIPAQATGEYSEFSKPEIPENLKAENVGQDIQLTWDSIRHPGFYGYFVYRGLHPEKISLVAGPLENPSYLDTAKSLNGRSTYFYRIASQNLRDDTSEYSEPAAISPNREMDLPNVEDIEFYYENGNLHLSWRDVRLMDEDVTGYILERKALDEPSFKPMFEGIYTLNVFVDSNASEFGRYDYRLAPVSFKGDTGAFGTPSYFVREKAYIDIVEKFTLSNTLEGLVVNLPNMQVNGRTYYNIYRRKAGETALKKIGQIPASEYRFLDESVEEGEIYVYQVTITFDNGTESRKGFSESIKRSTK